MGFNYITFVNDKKAPAGEGECIYITFVIKQVVAFVATRVNRRVRRSVYKHKRHFKMGRKGI